MKEYKVKEKYILRLKELEQQKEKLKENGNKHTNR